MTINKNEIKTVIFNLKRRGEYDKYLTPEADALSEKIGLMIAEVFPLTDKDVDAIFASIVPGPEETEEETIARVERVIRKIKGDDDDDGLAGVFAKIK